ncbi:MAG: extracellular solute-binding protein [Lachnospiraceae bacterium]|nr:extracellular solute-binding protein [Lachnospiraceae bacterium]
MIDKLKVGYAGEKRGGMMRKREGKDTKSRIEGWRAAATAIFACLCCMTVFAGCGEKEEEIPMGRYADREVKMPSGTFGYMHPCSDGSFYLYGTDADLTYVDAEGASKEQVWSWENTANIDMKYYVGVSDNGAAVFAYTPQFWTDEELEDLWLKGTPGWLYYYVDEAGQKHALEPYGESYQKNTNLNMFAFSPEGELYAASADNVYRVDVESGETVSLFATEGQVNAIVFVDNVLLAADREKTYLYDMTDGKLLENNSVLNDFVASHSNGGIVMAVSDRDIDVKVMADSRDAGNGNDGQTRAAPDGAADGDGTAGAQVLYMACRTGLYRYIWNGSVIEQIADGQMTALGDTQRNPLALQVLDNGEFRVFFTSNYMVEMYYDETLPARPSKELTVYSLEENGWIRYAGQLFQKEHPDVLVRYETGMEGDNAVSKEDALKNLNTRLLAGEAPDVIMLDGMDIEQYAQKGVLKELDGIMQPYLDDGILYQNIVEGMRMTEENKIYSVPMMVYLPLWLGEEMYLGGEDSLEDIVTGVELARQKHPEGPILYTLYPKDVLLQTIPVCLPVWTREDGSLDVEKLTEYYQAVTKIWELDCEGLDDAAREAWQKNNMELYEPADMNMVDITFNFQYSAQQNFGETWLQLGFLMNQQSGVSDVHVVKMNMAADWQKKEIEDVVTFGAYAGQADNVYWAKTIVGLCEQAKEPELAKAYLDLLLSDTMMRKWWLERPRSQSGLTIRKDSMRNIFDINNIEFGQMMGWKDPTGINYPDFWPTEEEQQWICQMMEDADCCYRPGTMLEETAMEVGLRVLEGELTPEEGAKEVAGKMAIAMEE